MQVRGVPQPRFAAGRPVRVAFRGTASLIVPGTGQFLAREPAGGLFFLAGVGFCGALLWAISTSMERIVPTLDLFGIPAIAPVAIAIGAWLAAGMLHVTGVRHADNLDPDAAERRQPHPVTAGLASLLVPGWGQILTGHRGRATLFLTASWITLGLWVARAPITTRILATAGLEIPEPLRPGFSLVLLIVLSLVTWSLAIYDAAAGAAMERR